MFRSLTASALIALSTLSVLPAAPVAADGAISLTLSPRNQRQADALRLGLGLYALHQHIEAGGTVRQFGRDNAAALAQRGTANWGVIDQRGSGHTGTLTQTGNSNVYGLFQSGRGTIAHVGQTGNGGTGVTIVHGF